MVKLTMDARLKLISRAWGKQTGYVFFPWINGDAEDRAQRVRGYHEGPAFEWPKDRDKIVEHMEAHTSDDLYWCPSIFEKKVRRIDYAGDEHALWADLDTVDPNGIDPDYRPTVAWESSPGRYQALWLITGGDIQGASWPGNENQKLTYYLEADPSGWDTTQLLRIPGWDNHKPEYKDANGGKPVPGQLLWHNGRRYLADDFDSLPEVRGQVGNIETDALEEAINGVDRLAIWGNVRLKVSKDVRELVAARSTGGSDRSDKLWQIERDLADAGCTVPEIVAIVRETIWNKFAGRNDELRRLVTEASKAVAERTEDTVKRIEKSREEKPRPGNLFQMVKEAKPPTWLVKDIVAVASCGFFSGEPKSYKSWSAFDLAMSIATGAPFLNAFDVMEPGPVLYIQEEDPLPTLKDRMGKIAPSKTRDRVTVGALGEDGIPQLVWTPAEDNDVVPKIAAIVREQFTISDPGWQAWLDEVLADGYGGTPEVRATEDGVIEGDTEDEDAEVIQERVQGEPFKLVVVDPLMMVAGDVDENRAQEMTEKIFKPLKQLAEKHQVAIIIVHHMAKTREGDNRRGGQKMLGSVANHAWSENSLYFTHGKLGTMMVEAESKFAPTTRFEIRNLRKRNSVNGLTWEPEVNMLDDEREPAGKVGTTRSTRRSSSATASTGRSPRVGQGTRRKLARSLGLDEDAPQGEVRAAWEAAGNVWGDFEGVVNFRGSDTDEEREPRKPGRKADPDPAALKVLRRLTERKRRAYSTHEIKDELAIELKQKPTQTVYLRAYQQLKKLYDQDIITRGGPDGKSWILPEVTGDDLLEADIEDLIT